MARANVRYAKRSFKSDMAAFKAKGRAARKMAVARARSTAIPMVVPGFTRRVGNYGRYSGAAAEKKFFDTALSFSYDLTGEVPATGQLCLILQGDTETTRDGRKATIESIQIRAQHIFNPGAAALATVNTWLYVVQDTQCNGAAAAVTDVFTSADMSGNMLNLNNSGRFRILMKKVVQFEPGAGVSGAYNAQVKPIDMFMKCNIPMDWSGATGAITEIRSNNIFLLAGAAGADDLVALAGTCRLRFRG